MPKPQWLSDIDNGVEKPKYEPKRCGDCQHFTGKAIREVRWKNKEKCMLWECAIHSGCYNTKHSVRCEDFKDAII